jgi:hypothetical protein
MSRARNPLLFNLNSSSRTAETQYGNPNSANVHYYTAGLAEIFNARLALGRSFFNTGR